MMPRKKADVSTENATDSEETKKPRKPRTNIPKEEITLILDAARSSTKFSVIFKGKSIACPKLPSVIADLINPLHQELGAYTVSLKCPKSELEDEEKPKSIIKHYVVGDRALLENNQIAMTMGHNHKVDYFHLLCLGAIAAIPNLFEMSTGSNEKNRTLTIKIVVLSLSDGKALLDKLKPCQWINVNGIKYKLNFLTNHSLYFAEGYGSAVWGHKKFSSSKHQELTVFDIGYGTACQTDYVIYGKLPLKKFVETNGGGGLGSLVTFLSRAMARGDSSRLIPTSEVRQILEDSIFEDGRSKAIANDGRDVSQPLELAISWWMNDSPLTFALDSISLVGRRQPVVMVGGSFAIPPIRERIKSRLLKAGASEELLLFPDNPGMLSIQGMESLYISDQPHLQVITNGTTTEKALEA